MKSNSQGASAPVVRNGFPIVTRLHLETHCIINMDAVEALQALFAAITLLAENHDAIEIKGLAKHGKNLADMLHNDIDCVREQVVKAGLEGYLAPEVCHD